MNIGGVMPLPEGTSIEEMAATLRFVISRNPALRTRLRFAESSSGVRLPRQAVAESGVVPLQIVDVGGDSGTAAAAEELRSRYEFPTTVAGPADDAGPAMALVQAVARFAIRCRRFRSR